MNGPLPDPDSLGLTSEAELVRAASALGAANVAGYSQREAVLVKAARAVDGAVSRASVAGLRTLIRAGHDPLGDAFCRLRTPVVRRDQGATYTPPAIVASMLDGVDSSFRPRQIVDPGCGSGRFLLAAATRYPHARLIGVELDPLAALIARANLAAAGHSKRACVEVADFRCWRSALLGKPAVAPGRRLSRNVDDAGPTLFVGNPPYVRHHKIAAEWKSWLSREAATLDLPASQLAGLHVHFLLAIARLARPGDQGVLITAAEWLDVNYGALPRGLFLGPLGGRRIELIEPRLKPFADADTTAAVLHFQVGQSPETIELRRIESLSAGATAGLSSSALGTSNKTLLDKPAVAPKFVRCVPRRELEGSTKWSHLLQVRRKRSSDHIELGEICRVHRGQVTGLNRVWITDCTACDLPASVLFPTVTKARELIAAGRVLTSSAHLRCVIDLPLELDELDAHQRRLVERFLQHAGNEGADRTYIAEHRQAWWRVGLRAPAPILVTYMARRPPAFVLNKARARHINIAHGLYPREKLSAAALGKLVDYLRKHASTHGGRTYAGGLTKFEPRELERLLVPQLELLTKSTALV